MPKMRYIQKKIWLYSKTDTSSIPNAFGHCTSVLSFPSINTVWKYICNLLLGLRSKFTPSAMVSTQSPKWHNVEIRHKLNCLRTLRRKVKLHPTPSNASKLSHAEQELQSLMETTKSAYESNLIANKNMKAIYSYLKQLSSTNSAPIHVYTNDSTQPTCNHLETAECFNKFFHSTFTISQYELPALDQLPVPNHQIHSISIDPADVSTALTSLDISKAYGCDDISPHLLHLCAQYLVPLLTDLFNMSLQTASIPQQWKVHKITPIHKKGSRSIVSNYIDQFHYCVLYQDYLNPSLTKKLSFSFGLCCHHISLDFYQTDLVY